MFIKRQICFRIISGVKRKLVNDLFFLQEKILLLLSSKVEILFLVNTEANWSEKHLVLSRSLLATLSILICGNDARVNYLCIYRNEIY